MLAVLRSDGWELDDGELRHLEAPDTFELPLRSERIGLRPGQIVKLIFRINVLEPDGKVSVECERMWVKVTGRFESYFVGLLDDDAHCTDHITHGLEVFFEPRHVIQVWSQS
jgi:hypothetical protein